MDDGAKKAGGAAAGLLMAIGAFFAHGADDCARVGGRAAMSVGDDVAVTGARSADDLIGLGHAGSYADDLAGSGARSADELAGLGHAGSYADDLVPSYGPGRTGASFGGAQFADDLAPATHADDVGASLSDDAIESVADVAIDVASEAAEFVASDDGDEPHALPVLRPEMRDVPPRSVRVLVLHGETLPDADRTVRSLAELDEALARGGEATLDLVVLPPEGDPLRAASDGSARSDDAVLVRAARLGRRAILVVCADDREPLDVCMTSAARVALAAASGGTSGIAERLAQARDASPSRRSIVLSRLHASEGSLQLAISR